MTDSEQSATVPPVRSHAERLAIDVVIASSRMVRASARMAETRIPTAVWRALSILDEHGPLRVGDFAALDRCSQPTATAMFQRLEKAGAVDRLSDPGDGRAVLVSLSGYGRQRLAELRGEVAAALGPRVAALDEEDRQALARYLVALHGLLSEDDEQSRPSEPGEPEPPESGELDASGH